MSGPKVIDICDDRIAPRTDRGLVESALQEAEQLPAVQTVPVAIPDSFGGLALLREIHRGAQGVVYEAMQAHTSRRVAVKVLREGPFADRSEKARIEREVHILSQFKHPNIVTVYDSGEVAGHSYYVMDLITGDPLDVWMAGSGLSVEQTLGLFANICEAVGAAHLRGVIHRDLKPGNILVDADGQPHVLDFGLAKTMPSSEPGSSMPLTFTGQFLGSLPWASPEQTQSQPDRLDLRSDVYSLGVILYQMLTGRFPYGVMGTVHDVIGNILTADPHKPSSIRRQIDNEVETILLKCLRKEPQRRYDSAVDVARDVQRYLAREPILAKADSALYVLKKKCYRHKWKLIAACAITIFITGFGVYAIQVEMDQRALHQAGALVAEGRALQELNVFSAARAKYDEALSLVPDLYEAIGHKAYVLKDEYCNKEYSFRDTGLLEDSLLLCDQALALKPDRHGTWNLRCALLYSLGRLDEAERACHEALRLKPDYHYASSNLARVLALQHRFDEAAAVMEDGIQFARTKAEPSKYDDGVWRTLAALQMYRGDADAAESLHKARQINERDKRNWLMLARLHLLLPGHIDPGLALQEAAHAHAYTKLRDPRFGRILAQALVLNGRFEEALLHAQAAIDGGDSAAYGYLISAVAQAGLGNAAAAEEQMGRASDNWPAEFQAGATVMVTAEKEFLWLDTLSELDSLRQEARRMLEKENE